LRISARVAAESKALVELIYNTGELKDANLASSTGFEHGGQIFAMDCKPENPKIMLRILSVITPTPLAVEC
jgi:hypothetical protein